MNKKNIFVIEHMEPELWEWCIIEYKHISKMVGKENVWFTNIQSKDIPKLSKYGKVFGESVKKMHLDKACILDPEAKETLTPGITKKCNYLIFGGILGDNPPRKRTKEELNPFLPGTPAYNIGKEQMSTDNAVYVVHEITKGKKLENLEFQDGLEIEIDEIESTQFPYKYAIVNGKPLISKELVKFLKKG